MHLIVLAGDKPWPRREPPWAPQQPIPSVSSRSDAEGKPQPSLVCSRLQATQRAIEMSVLNTCIKKQNHCQATTTRAEVGTEPLRQSGPGGSDQMQQKVMKPHLETGSLNGSEAKPNANTASTHWSEEPGQVTCLPNGWASTTTWKATKKPSSCHLPPHTPPPYPPFFLVQL